MIQAKRIGHATFETPDIDRQVAYYTEIMGLSLAESDKGRAFLTTKQGHHAVLLEKGDHARCTRLSFQVAPDSDLTSIAAKLSGEGIRSEKRTDVAPGLGEVLAFEDPKGTAIDIFAEATALSVDDRLGAFNPLKLGHLAFNVVDINKLVEFYGDVLGFRVSDWRSDFFVFLRCGSDHHTINFASHGHAVKMHHVAFELKDWPEVLRACDFLGKHNYHLVWGPGRHIIGHNIFIYHRNPDGQIVELYTELDQMENEDLGYFLPRPWHQDNPQRPKVWPADTLGSYWGGRAPPGFGE
jgi:catechol-2,3-dioxygenase